MGRIVFFLVHNKTNIKMPPARLLWPVFSDCCCLLKFSNQMQLLKFLFCYFSSSFQ